MACRTDSGSTQLHRLGDGKSRVAGEDTPHAPRAFADHRASVNDGADGLLGSTQLHRLGGGESRVAGEDTPSCSASVRRPPSLRQRWGRGFWGQLSCAGSGTAKVASRARIRPMLCERSPTPEPSGNAGADGLLGSTQLHRLGGGESRVAGEDTPPCSASVGRPPSLPCTDAFRRFGTLCYRRCDRTTCRTWAAITDSSSVGITQAETRLAGVLIRGPWPALALGSISRPSHSRPAAI